MNPRDAPPPERAAEAPQTVLFVDDDADILASVQLLVEGTIRGSRVVTRPGAREALEVLGGGGIDVIITDYRMPEMDGLAFLEEARRRAPEVPRILVTAYPDLQVALRAINEGGVQNFIPKPWDPDRFLAIVRETLERRARERRA